MDRKFEQGINGESLGIPQDLLTDPAKYEADIPLWRRTLGLVKQYGTTRPNKRDVFFDQTVSPFVKEPTLFKQLFENLNLIAQLKPEINVEEIKTGLITHAEAVVSRRASLAGWTPKKIEQLIILGLNSSGEFKNVVEKMQAALFNAPKTIEEAVDLFYNAAFAMVQTNEPDIREELFSILCLEKVWLNEKADSVTYLEVGGFSSDDLHLGRYFAFEDALEQTGKLVEMSSLSSNSSSFTDPFTLDSRRVASRNRRYDQPEQRPGVTSRLSMRDLVQQTIRKNPSRYRKITDYMENSWEQDLKNDIPRATSEMPLWEAAYRKMEEFRHRPWPENVMKNPDESLRRLVRERLNILILKAFWEQQKASFLQRGYQVVTPRYLQVTEWYLLDILARGYDTPEQKNQVIREIYTDFAISDNISPIPMNARGDLTPTQVEEAMKLFAGGIHTFGEQAIFALIRAMPMEITGKLAAILEFHRPLMTVEQVRAIDQRVKQIRLDIMTDFTRGVGKRGYRLSVADPVLRHLGYQTISFQQASNQIETSMEIDKQTYQFGIDKDFRLILDGDIKRFQSPQDRAWLELLVLSHLKKVMCSEEDEKTLKEELVLGEKQYQVYRRQVTARSEHSRRLTPGERFSSEQYRRCLKSNLPIKDLVELNRLKALAGKGGTLETGLWTYVSGVEWTDIPEIKPIRIAFKKATDDLREVLHFGAISPEEMTRIENEILGELEKN